MSPIAVHFCCRVPRARDCSPLVLQMCSTYHIGGGFVESVFCGIGMMRPLGDLSVRDGLRSCGAMVVVEALRRRRRNSTAGASAGSWHLPKFRASRARRLPSYSIQWQCDSRTFHFSAAAMLLGNESYGEIIGHAWSSGVDAAVRKIKIQRKPSMTDFVSASACDSSNECLWDYLYCNLAILLDSRSPFGGVIQTESNRNPELISSSSSISLTVLRSCSSSPTGSLPACLHACLPPR
jgi:hypothetical protein